MSAYSSGVSMSVFVEMSDNKKISEYTYNVLSNTKDRNVLVVLMHDYSKNTRLALPDIIEGLKEQLVKTILKEFIAFIDNEENCEIVQKELDNSLNPSIHCDDEQEYGGQECNQ